MFMGFLTKKKKKKKKFNNVDKKTYDFTIRVVGSNINLDRFYYEIDLSRF